MRKPLLNENELDYFKQIVKGNSTQEIINLFNKKFNRILDTHQVKNLKRKYNLKSGRNRLYNQEQIDYLKSIIKGYTTQEIINLMCEKYNIKLTKEQIKNFKNYYHISSGINTKWQKGRTPYNKKPIGTEISTNDGYILVKVGEPSEYKFKHHIIWEQHYGKIPEGHYVIFLDQDRTNYDINNLKLVRKEDLMMACGKKLFFKNKELTETGLLIAQLEQKRKEKYKC